MKNDVENYIAKRKCTDTVFAKHFEAGYAGFKRRLSGRMANTGTARTHKVGG